MQTLGYILIAKPEFMLQEEILNLIEASLSSGVDHRLKVCQSFLQLHLACIAFCSNL
jgi:hypothetical protein